MQVVSTLVSVVPTHPRSWSEGLPNDELRGQTPRGSGLTVHNLQTLRTVAGACGRVVIARCDAELDGVGELSRDRVAHRVKEIELDGCGTKLTHDMTHGAVPSLTGHQIRTLDLLRRHREAVCHPVRASAQQRQTYRKHQSLLAGQEPCLRPAAHPNSGHRC